MFRIAGEIAPPTHDDRIAKNMSDVEVDNERQ
jgi:hypothetical protein